MIKRKGDVVAQTSGGINFLMKKNKVDVYQGFGSFKNKNTVLVTDEKGKITELSAEKVIIATGSKPAVLPFIKIDKKRIITSPEALNLTEVPKHMIVIGGGVIGLELGSVYARLGSKVSVVEFMPGIIPTMDLALGKELQKVLKKDLGFEFYMSHKVTSVKGGAKDVEVSAENSKGETVTLKGDYAHLQTNVPGIYAIGDVVKGAMLAHKAEEEGTLVAEVIAGQKPHIDYNLIPGVVYTWPEVAAVGKTEEQLKAENIEYKSGMFPFKASGRARASMDTDGFVKVLSHKITDEILGVHMIGPRVADMIAEAVVAMEFRASAEDIGRISHAHPTFTESFKEAALDASDKRAIHI